MAVDGRLDRSEALRHAVCVVLRRPRILVVDDEPLVGRVIVRALGSDHEVFYAADGHAALQRIVDGERYDAILCELCMAGMGGLELHRELGQVAPQQRRRMVFLRGGNDTQSMPSVLDHLDNVCVAKPFTMEQIQSIVRECLYSPAL
jgi:CheY-like chemotaxis protein